MDALIGTRRNGLDGDFFNFVPLLPVAYGVGATKVLKKSKEKKFKNRKAQELALKYPHKLTSDEQDEIISIVSKEQRNLVDEKNKAKGLKRAGLNGELKGYDEYLTDLRNVRDELLKKEKEAFNQLQQKSSEQPKIEVNQEMTKVEQPINTGGSAQVLSNENINSQTPTQPTKSANNMLYLGIGAVLLVGIILVMRKK